jgi:hypothetical protein
MPGTVVAGAGTALLPSITTTGDLNTGMWFPAADTIAFSEGGVEALRIDSSGIHLRSSAPAIEFDDSGFATVRGRIYSNEGNLLLEADYNNSRSGSNIAFNVDATERMRIDSSGNVGIGTSNATPSNGEGLCLGSSSTITRLDMRNTTTGDATGDGTSLQLNGNDFTIENREAGYVAVSTSLTERMRIDSSGNVGIGTTSPESRLSVLQSAVDGNALVLPMASGATDENFTSIRGKYGVGNEYCRGEVRFGVESFATGSGFLAFATGTNTATERMRIDSSGNVGIGTTSPAAKLHVEGTNAVMASTGLVTVQATTSGADVGGQITFQNNTARRAAIAGRQEASDAIAGYLQFGTRGTSGDITERMRIDSSGNVLVGKAVTTYTTDGITLNPTGVIGASKTSAGTLELNRNGTDGAIQTFFKSGVTVGSIGVSQADLWLGTGISGLYFYDGSSSVIPWDAGSITTSDNVLDLGHSAYRWQDIYATNGSINTSDRTEKQDIDVMSEAETRVAVACKGLIRKFRWIDAVAEKGDDARIHFGIIAQDLQDAFAAEGLDAGRYAMFISNTWWKTQTDVPAVEAVAEVLDEEGNVVTEAVEAKEAYTRTDTYETLEEAPEGATERTRLGVRYPELLAFIIGAL